MILSDASLLARAPLFAEVAAQDRDALATRLRPRAYGKGDVIFVHGDPGTHLCLVESGQVKLGFTSAMGREIILDLVGPGEVFGELALLDGAPRSADAVALEPTHLLLLHRDDFVRFVEEHPHFAMQLLATLSRRLRRDAELLQDGAFLDVSARLARTLLRLAQAQGPTGDEGRLVTPRLTQSDLAAMVGTTRETLNKWLSFFQQEGWVDWERSRVVVLQPQALRRRII
jgi:CRP-like cAMP-binding protein